MVAEDNEFTCAILRSVFLALGARNLRYAKNGAEAVQIAKTFDIDIGLIDWDMPVMDGLEFTRFMRTAEDTPDPFLPIIMMTAYSEFPRVLKARDGGVTEYLIKPFSAAQLVKRIRSVVESPRPFVRTKKFFGPDRRRHQTSNAFTGPERRKSGTESQTRQ